MQTFGARLRAARNAIGITQERLGELVGVSKAAVSRWESDVDQPQMNILPKLRIALRTSLDSLLCGDRPYQISKGAQPPAVRDAAHADASATRSTEEGEIEVALQSILMALIENAPASAGSFVEATEALVVGRKRADGKALSTDDPMLGSLIYIARQALKRWESVGRRDLLRDAVQKPK